jgi:hypothetical protein
MPTAPVEDARPGVEIDEVVDVEVAPEAPCLRVERELLRLA